jgi:hypothetical protein
LKTEAETRKKMAIGSEAEGLSSGHLPAIKPQASITTGARRSALGLWANGRIVESTH